METIFFHFLRHQSTAAIGSSFFFNWNIFFSQSSIPASENEFFVYWKQCFFIPSFFLLMKNITEICGKSNFKDEPYSCKWTPIFFNFFRYFLKRKPCFRIVKVYFSISLIRLGQTNFPPVETMFFVRAISLVFFSVFFFSVYWKRLFQRNPSLWSVETDFPASWNRFFCFFVFFQRLFLLVETVTETSGSEKKEHMLTNITDILASGTHFTFYFIFWDNSQLLPVETVHSSTRTCFSIIPSFRRGNEFFVYWKQYCSIPSFFC